MVSQVEKFLGTVGTSGASFHNHFTLDRHINHRSTIKSIRNAALSEGASFWLDNIPYSKRCWTQVAFVSQHRHDGFDDESLLGLHQNFPDAFGAFG